MHEWLCVALLVTLTLFGCQGNNEQQAAGLDIDSEPEPTAVQIEEGKQLALSCNVTESPDVYVRWTKNQTGSSFVSTGTTLSFSVINRTDAGQYLCHSNDTSVPTTHNVTLVRKINIDVQYAAKVVMLTANPTVVRDGKNFNITCKATGNPLPNISLKKNDTGEEIVLALLNERLDATMAASCINAGAYDCYASNSLNKERSTKTLNVTVFCKPEVSSKFPSPETNVGTRLGVHNVSFEFHTLGYPAPTFTWSRAGNLPPSTQTSQPNFARLTFHNISIDTYGLYHLTASNSMGSYLANFSLWPVGPPETPKNLKVISVTQTSVTLSFFCGYDYGSPQRFDVMNRSNNRLIKIDLISSPSTPGRQTVVHTVRGLTSGVLYDMAVNAFNREGYSGYSNSVSIRTSASNSGSHVGAVVGGVIGGVCVIAGVAVVLVCVLKYRRKKTTIPYGHMMTNRGAGETE